MKQISMVLLVAISGFSLAASGDDGATQHKQTTCPVMGGKIDSSVYVDMQGQRVYLCCPACVEKFKADPDTYFKKAAADGVVFENVQKVCPISGKTVKSDVYADFEGRRIFFCCQSCAAEFKKDPKKVLAAMDK